MAFLTRNKCLKCGTKYTKMIGAGQVDDKICPSCTQKEEEDKKQVWLDEQKQRSIEERIATIEDWLYEFVTTNKRQTKKEMRY